MGKLQILEPAAITAVTVTGGGSNPSGVGTDDPKDAFQQGATSQLVINMDLGSVKTLDAIFTFAWNADAGSFIIRTVDDINGTNPTNLTGAIPFRPADTETPYSKAYATFAPTASRYWQLLTQNNTVALSIGRIALGAAFEPEWDKEWGSGRRVIDTGEATALRSGGFAVREGARKASYSWTMGDLTDDETQTLFDMQLRLGVTSPLVVNEQEGAADHVSNRLRYGLFRSLERYERRDPQATRWQLEVEDWL